MTIDEFRDFLTSAPEFVFNQVHEACVELAVNGILPERGGFSAGTEWDEVLNVCDELFESKNPGKSVRVSSDKLEQLVRAKQNIGMN